MTTGGRFGKFTAEADEVLQFIESNKLLAGGHLPHGIEARVINEVSDIPKEEDYEAFDDERPLWRDIIDNEAAKFFCLESDTEKAYDPIRSSFFSNLFNELMNKYATTFPKYYRQNYLDQDIPGILSYILHCRIVLGKQHDFFELLFKIFQSGGYPCGWDGYYPKGKVIAFYPEKSALWKE